MISFTVKEIVLIYRNLTTYVCKKRTHVRINLIVPKKSCLLTVITFYRKIYEKNYTFFVADFNGVFI